MLETNVEEMKKLRISMIKNNTENLVSDLLSIASFFNDLNKIDLSTLPPNVIGDLHTVVNAVKNLSKNGKEKIELVEDITDGYKK